MPLVTVITRKAFGGAYDVMASKHIGADVNYAWPTAQIAVMGAKGAVEIIFRGGDAEKIARQTKEYEERFLSPFVAAERGYIDEVIMPHSTRRRVARALAMLGPRRSSSPGASTTTFRCKITGRVMLEPDHSIPCQSLFRHEICTCASLRPRMTPGRIALGHEFTG